MNDDDDDDCGDGDGFLAAGEIESEENNRCDGCEQRLRHSERVPPQHASPPPRKGRGTRRNGRSIPTAYSHQNESISRGMVPFLLAL